MIHFLLPQNKNKLCHWMHKIVFDYTTCRLIPVEISVAGECQLLDGNMAAGRLF